MKWFLIMVIGFIIIMSLCIAAFSGCSLLQMSPADKIASLPTTGPEAMFQTLKKANWLFTLSVIGVGAGFYAFLNGSSKGIQVMASCFVVLSLIIGVTKYSAVIAAIAMIGAVCLMIYSTLVKGKALREVVQGVELARTIALEGDEIYPENKILNAMSNMQSKTTEAIVKAVKGKL